VLFSAVSSESVSVSRRLNKPRTVPKSPAGLGNARAVCSTNVPRPEFKPIEHSVYIGRERLGRYVQADRNKYKAFDANDDPLGNFRVRARMLAAIDKAWRARQ
jgi:hypothetical protein